MKYLLRLFAVTVLIRGELSAQSMEQDIVEEKFEIQIKYDAVVVKNQKKGYDFKLKVHDYVDFNNDGLMDIITLDSKSCGNWGDCIYSFFLQQSDTAYECIFSDYLYRFNKTENTAGKSGEKWLKFDVFQRTDIGGNLESGEEYVKHEGLLEFNGKKYVLRRF